LERNVHISRGCVKVVLQVIWDGQVKLPSVIRSAASVIPSAVEESIFNFSAERLEHCHYQTRAGRKQARRLESCLKRFLHCAMLRIAPVEMTIVGREKSCGKTPDPSIISSRIGSQRLAWSVERAALSV